MLGVRHMADLYFAATQSNGAFVRLINAAENFHQSRFPRAVLSDERNDLTRVNREIDFAQCDDTRKSLGDTTEFENRVLHCRKETGAKITLSQFGAPVSQVSLMSAQFFQVSPKFVDVALINRSRRNNDFTVRRNVRVFIA